MTGRAAILLLLIALLGVGACTPGSLANGLPAPGADLQIVELVGDEVYSLAGRWLGTVAGVLLDADTGGVRYVVLSYQEPGVYGWAVTITDPQRFVPIPWALFMPGDEDDTLHLDADEMTLIPAPYLEAAPDSLDTAQASAIDDYWRSVALGEPD